jgi:DNA-binding GntR family transcriptional regulator
VKRENVSNSISVVDLAVQTISQYIASGRFVAGQRLPEGDLAEQLGVSKNVLREAFARLQQDGILEVQRFRGAMVRRLSYEDALKFLVVYTDLLGVAMREAALNIASDPSARAKIKELRAHVRSINPQNQSEHLDEFYSVHDAIVELADNIYLSNLLKWGMIVLFKRFIIESVPLTQEVVEQTKRLDHVLDFVERGEGEAAFAALRSWSKLERAWVNPQAVPQSTS